MPCPNSPEPDGYHRFQLQSSGTPYASTCVYCGLTRHQSGSRVQRATFLPRTRRPTTDGGQGEPSSSEEMG